MRKSLNPPFKIAVDIGGTFTDCVILDVRGNYLYSKAFTTFRDYSAGVLDALSSAASSMGTTLTDLLERTESLVHGCTVGTNAMLERTGSKTGLITTKGFEDTILIGRVFQRNVGLTEREIMHVSQLDKAYPPLVPRDLIWGVPERIDSRGEVVVPLNEKEAEKAVEYFVERGVEAIAICFLWSFLNPAHEQAVEELIRKRHPKIYVTTSARVAPLLGEYERTVTAVVNSYIGPKVLGYLNGLATKLGERGYRHDLSILQANGGLANLEEIVSRPIATIDSGPVGGTLGCKFFGSKYGRPDILCTDMGGTSFDVSLIYRKELQFENSPTIEKYTMRMPKVLVRSIGAGGGSIAWMDEAGALRVGPRSAGAEPGPACYEKGGTEPTVTDADLVLGYLNPQYFLGGRKVLNKQASEKALAKVAEVLGVRPVEAAWGIFRIVNAQMSDLIRKCTIERGYDPRDFILVAYGGAGPTHCVFYGADLGVKLVLVPGYSTVFSAFGMLASDFIYTSQLSVPFKIPGGRNEVDRINSIFSQLAKNVLARFEKQGANKDQMVLVKSAFMKYKMQMHEIEVFLPSQELGADGNDIMRKEFEVSYARVYGEQTVLKDSPLEITSFKVDGILRQRPPTIRRDRKVSRTSVDIAKKGERSAFFGGWRKAIKVQVYDGEKLRYGQVLKGPCIVERMGDTLVLPPRMEGQVDQFRNILIHLG